MFIRAFQLDSRNICQWSNTPIATIKRVHNAQVRDGQYGFSDSLGKHCGNQFPSIISSSDKYMWLHFHSDDNIEYIGFEGVYTFTPRPPNAGNETTEQNEIRFLFFSLFISPFQFSIFNSNWNWNIYHAL